MEKESSHKTGERMKLEDEVRELKNLAEGLKVDILEKDTRLNHLQKQNDELSSLLSKSRDEVIKEFKTSSEFTDLLDKNNAASSENFRMDTIESFPGVDFDSIKLPIPAKSPLLQTGSADANIEDDASIPHPMKDDSKSGGVAPSGLSS